MASSPSQVPALVLQSKRERTAVHVATEHNDFKQFAATFVERVIDHHKRKDIKSMYWLSFDVALPPTVPADYAVIHDKGTEEYKRAWEMLAAKKNVCLLGPGGTGKSYMIRWVKYAYLDNDNATIVTASTANAAFLLGGITLHRMSGLPVWVCDDKYDLKEAFDKYIRWASRLNSVVHTICQMQLWICDEISMIYPRIFQLVDLAMRYFRRQPYEPFGGVYFLWSGDFLQIPPVVKQKQGKRDPKADNNPFLFSHEAWLSCWQPVIIPFTVNKRSQAREWSDLLARVRMGIISLDDIRLLDGRTEAALRFRDEWDEFMSGPVTHIYPTNADVNRENNLARAKLVGPDHSFPLEFATTTNVMTETWTEQDEEHYRRWAHSINVIPQTWYPKLDSCYRLLEPDCPWYNVLARSITLEQKYTFRELISDEEAYNVLASQIERFAQENRIPLDQVFRLGEKVRLTVNLAYSRGLVNGITGRIVGFSAHGYHDNDKGKPIDWVSNNIRQLKRVMMSNKEKWLSCVYLLRSMQASDSMPVYASDTMPVYASDETPIDEDDLWSEAIIVTSYPRTLEQLEELKSGNVLWQPANSTSDIKDLHTLGQLRALWMGSVCLEPLQDLGEGSFVWTRDSRVQGWPIVEWSTGERTILPRYDWSIDYKNLMAREPGYKASDRWMIHLYGLPIKPAHAITYHDSQGQTCERVYLGNVAKLFTDNMLYVGLSRAPTLESVALCNNFCAKYIKAHPSAVNFFQTIETFLAPKDDVGESDAHRTKRPHVDPRPTLPSPALPSHARQEPAPSRIRPKSLSILSSLYCQ